MSAAAADAWTVLIAQAMRMAAVARTLPMDAAGDRVRHGVPWLVQLMAVELAMDRLAELEPSARPYARDQAELLLQQACERLRERWHAEPMPVFMLEAMERSRAALARSLYAGLSGLRWNGERPMVIPAWTEVVREPGGTLAVMEPGTVALPGECVAWWTEREPLACRGCVQASLSAPVQVYRVFDPDGRFLQGREIPLHEPLIAGMPMLVPLWLDGKPVGSLQREPVAWLAMQRRAGVPVPA
jgi:hypothetical protein